MGLPRSVYVKDGEIAVYHCFSRCVRRAFLCGFDPVSRRDFSHRKNWIVDRLQFLASIFAIDVCAFSIMDTHHHSILRTRPDIAASWSDHEVASRWLSLFPKSPKKHSPSIDQLINALISNPDRISLLRKRLSSISWFMARLNEFIARLANKEDNVKGRFWESRFKSIPLLDHPAIAAAMVYVELNPIRAGLAPSPELSNFTSIQLRIRNPYSPSSHNLDPLHTPPDSSSNISSSWLCPIRSTPHRNGILPISEHDYLQLVDSSARKLQSDKPSPTDSRLNPILLGLHAKPDSWVDTISKFQSMFPLAAGRPSSLRSFALKIARRRIKGLSTARIAFSDPSSHST